MSKNNETNCGCEKSTCCCATGSAKRCTCGDNCKCERVCKCGSSCGCPCTQK